MARPGQPADHGRGRRVYLSGLFTFAVSRKYAAANPVALVKLDEHKKTSKASVTPVTKAQIGDMATACRIIAAMGSGIQQDYAHTVRLAGMRPSEVAALRVKDCRLPAEGWGELELAESAATATKAFTDSGTIRDDRALKHRRTSDRRIVPIPPSLVTVLRERINGRKTGHVFETDNGVVVHDACVGGAWRDARSQVLGDDTETLTCIYDLRHLCVSMMLDAGVAPVEVAARAGHSVATCVAVYAHVIVSERSRWNSVIEAALET